MKTSVSTRRSFLKSSLAGVVAAGVAPQIHSPRLLGAKAPSNQVTLGCIGVGAHGFGVNLKQFLQEDDCRIVAVCDVFGSRRARRAGGRPEVRHRVAPRSRTSARCSRGATSTWR
jgi:hypothetical protein